MPRAKQLTIDYRPWGGKRKGAGRKRVSPRPRVVHSARPRHTHRHPIHVTLRLRAGLPSLRHPVTHGMLLQALVAGSGRFGINVVHYSAMSNHIHLICEAANARSIRWGMSALTVRIARALNGTWRRKGPVFDDRFHARPLCTPREVRNALAYVLQNALHHGIHFPGGIDPFSSSRWFDGWTRPIPGRLTRMCSPLPRHRTWLLALGWKRGGLLDPLVLLRDDGTVRRRIKLRGAR